MLFSILVANYNNSPYIEQCIDSLVTQTYGNIEIVILDDCSTDNSLEKLNTIETIDSRIKLFTNETNQGIGWTKRKLVELSKGDIFGFVDPDDMLETNAILTMVEKHNQHKHVGLIYSNLVNLFPDGSIKGLSDYNCSIPKESSFLEFGKGISAFATFKREFYKKTEGINPLLKIAEDQDIYFKMEEVSPVLFIDEPLYLYRNHVGSISLFDNQVRAHVWQVIARYEAYKRRGIKIDEVKLTNYFLRREYKHKAIIEHLNTAKGAFWQLIKTIKSSLF